MTNLSKRPHQPSTWLQLIVNFVIPIFILTRLSSESQLGPVNSLLLALAFPIVFEIYNVYKLKKFSILSVIAIGGIVVTGGISLLGLNEDWLAARRALPFLVVALVFLISNLIKRPIVGLVAPHVLDIPKITKQAQKNNVQAEFDAILKRAGYFISIVLILVAVASFVLTKATILSPTDTAAFNQEYARLRLLSIPVVTLPLVIGITAVIYYLASAIEKLTGLGFEEILKKKPRKQ